MGPTHRAGCPSMAETTARPLQLRIVVGVYVDPNKGTTDELVRLIPSKSRASRGRMDRRLLLSVLLLLAAGAAAFGVERGATAEYCFLRCNPDVSAPFLLGTATAIHLGNTKSCIAGYDLYPASTYYQFCIPSWVAFTDNGTTLTGEAAMNHAALSPGTAISGFKRLLGVRLEDEVAKREMERVPHKFTERRGRLSIQLETQHKEFSLEHIAGVVISELKRTAEAHLGREMKRAVITVPHQLTHGQRQGVRFAGLEHAGFRAVRVVDEQIAAAAAHGLHTKQGDRKAVLVFHLGGRTSGATLFKFINGTAFLLDARAHLFLGGDDFTGRVVDYFVKLIREKHHMDVRKDKDALLRLWAACERAKKALSGDQQETLVQMELLVDGGVNFSAPLTRAKFEELNHDLFDRAMEMVNQVVMRRGGRYRVIDEIVVVGGSTRIPKVRQLLKVYFHGREPRNSEGVEPDEAIVHGAALLSRPEAARFLEECFDHWYQGVPGFI